MAKLIFTSFELSMMSVSFYGLKENIQYGHEAINRVKSEFPDGFVSSSYYDVFVQDKDSKILEKYNQAIYKTRDLISYKNRITASLKKATRLAVKETGAANCGEQARLVSQQLDEMGIKNKIICMEVHSNKDRELLDGHTFCVVDTDNPIDPREPRNWSSDAVVVDMWSNTVAKSKDALKFFHSFLKPNPQTQYVEYFEVEDY